MRKAILSILVSIFSSSLLAQTPADTLKVLTFNVYGAPESEWAIRQTMIIDELEKLNPDIICLQEIVETPGLESFDNRVKVFADSLFERTGSGYAYVWERTHFSWNIYDEGIAVLTPHIILDHDFEALPAGLFPRKCLWAKLLTPLGIVNVFDTHLSFGAQEETRITQVHSLKEYIEEKSEPNGVNIVCGDFNATPDSPPIQLLTQPDPGEIQYIDSWAVIHPADPGWTVPSNQPNARIDYVFLRDSSEASILSAERVIKTPNSENVFPSDHIGVMAGFNTGVGNLNVSLLSPGEGDEVSGETLITWSLFDTAEDIDYKLYVSRNGGKHWALLWEGASPAISTSWNTFSFADGANYRLRLAAIGDSSFGLTQTEGTFTVNNPGNAPPELTLISPRGGEEFGENTEIRWEAKDADSDPILITLEYSVNDGQTWVSILNNTGNSGTSVWSSQSAPNSSRFKLKISATDGLETVSEISGYFTIDNPRENLPALNVSHSEGNGTGTVQGNVYDETMLTGHLYQLTFNDSIPGQKSYTVTDMDLQLSVIEDIVTPLDGVTEGPPFDGIRLIINDIPAAVKDDANSGWLPGNTNLDHNIFLPVINLGDVTLTGLPEPADYTLTISDQVMDTSSGYLGVQRLPMKFSVHNESEDYPVDVIFLDNNSDQTIGPLDEVYILEDDEEHNPVLTWAVFFENETVPVLPAPGDVFHIKTLKPFSNPDIFDIYGTLTASQVESGNTPGSFALMQNFPNPFNTETAIHYVVPVSGRVELTIYNVKGQSIEKVIQSHATAGKHIYRWSGDKIPSGIYFYKVEAGGFSDVKKMILLR